MGDDELPLPQWPAVELAALNLLSEGFANIKKEPKIGNMKCCEVLSFNFISCHEILDNV